MKKMITCVALAFASIFGVNAQTGINYQAVVRDGNGAILANQSATIVFNILEGSTSGTTVYSESQTLTTNAYGNVVAIIGQGTATTGTFSTINWSANDHFLNVTVDGTDMGTTQFMSVPYAMSANMAKRGANSFTVDSTIMIKSGLEFNFIKTGADGKLYFQQNGDHNLSSTALILDDDSKTVSRTKTGVDNDLLPIAYGNVSSLGSVFSSSSNVTVNKTGTGVYEINITGGGSSNYHDYITIISAETRDGYTVENNLSAEGVRITTYNQNGTAADSYFQFVIYKP